MPMEKDFTKRMSMRMLALEETARKRKGVLESPRAEKAQQGMAGGKACGHEEGAQDGACNQGGVDGGFHGPVVFGAEQLGHGDRASDVAPEGKGDEDKGDVVAVAHGCKGVFADKPAGYQGVGDVVELLKYDAAEHGQAECPQNFLRVSLCHIFVHM